MSYSFSCPDLEHFILSTVYITGRTSSFQLRAFIAVGYIDLPLLLSEFEADFFGIKDASYRFWHSLLISRALLWWQIVTFQGSLSFTNSSFGTFVRHVDGVRYILVRRKICWMEDCLVNLLTATGGNSHNGLYAPADAYKFSISCMITKSRPILIVAYCRQSGVQL